MSNVAGAGAELLFSQKSGSASPLLFSGAGDNSGTYPNLEILLKILATLAVTTCSSERSFSALKHLKSYLRSTMVESRLNGLAALYIHKDIVLNKEAVINEISKDNRRMKFL